MPKKAERAKEKKVMKINLGMVGGNNIVLLSLLGSQSHSRVCSQV